MFSPSTKATGGDGPEKKGLLSVNNILVAEDHPLFRQALADVAGRLAEGVQCQTAEDCASMLAAIESDDSFDLLMLDYFLPGAEGFGAVMAVRAKAPGIPVLIVSSLTNLDVIRQAAALGVAGFVNKSADSDTILDALRRVLAGGTSFPDDLRGPPSERKTKLENDKGEPLTLRQMEVLRIIAQGKSNKEIARQLGISQETVKVHISAILRRLDCASRAQAVMAARDFLSDRP